jgi:hypothetical protein
VRHGHLPEREVMTGIGPVPVKVPRVRDRKPGEDRIAFTPSILPRYLRRAKSVEELLPWLYLKGVSTGDFGEALAALLGPDAKGLSAKTITRLKADWWEDYEAWQKRDLGARRFLYIWTPSRDICFANALPGNGRRLLQTAHGRGKAMRPGGRGRRRIRPQGAAGHDPLS